MTPSASGTLCPSCGELIPAGQASCPRCRRELTPNHSQTLNPHDVRVPIPGATTVQRAPIPTSWQEIAFKVISILILSEGAVSLVAGLVVAARTHSSNATGLLFHGALAVFTGGGLLAEWSIASLILKIQCWLSLATGALIGLSLFFSMGTTLLGWSLILTDLALMGMYGFMLYLVNEVGLD